VHAVVAYSPNPQIIAARGQQILARSLLVRDEHDLRARVRVIEPVRRLRRKLPSLLVQRYDLNLVAVLLHERPEREAVLLVLPHLKR